jgi:Eukaryotic cytochrome b561
MLDWWLASVSGATAHEIDAAIAWHGRLMVLAWSALAPVALLWARYWKIAPDQDFPRVLDDKRWWHAHRGLQSLAALCTAIALWLVWRDGAVVGVALLTQLHHWLGWAVGIAVAAQIAHGLMRGSKGGPTDAQMRGDHYDMTPRRIAFERIHKSLGWLTLAAAWMATLLGLWLADAPRWMVASVLLWWLLLAAAWIRWQRAGRCVDTYQTIWGTAANLPGMARAAVGWGVRRYTARATESDVDADHNASARNKGIG